MISKIHLTTSANGDGNPTLFVARNW